eukprot:4332578-Amphidinium_carterae.1
MIRWRLRDPSMVNHRFVHAVDSQVALGVLVKGRSSSIMLNRILRKINSTILAGNLLPSYVFIRTDLNPADAPSRWSNGAR